MTENDRTQFAESYARKVTESLLAAGFSPAAAEALLALDGHQFLYVRRVMKGDVPQSLIDELGSGLELTQFHALSAIIRIECGIGRGGAQEATVGLLAEEMNVDPSRASRIAADLVERGLLRRAVSQSDGRRSVLMLTETARGMLAAFRDAKWQRSMKLFRDWPEEDVAAFARLFGRFVADMGQQYPERGRG